MAYLKEIQADEVACSLPAISPYIPSEDSTRDELFLCACGFEPRSTRMAAELQKGRYRTKHSIFFEYETNPSHNLRNRPELVTALSAMSETEPSAVIYRDQDFITSFGSRLNSILAQTDPLPKVTLDISACSSELMLCTLRLLFERRIRLRILYSEAAVYHPTALEYENCPGEWATDAGGGMSSGILKVKECAIYPGTNSDQLPTTLIAFPTFKPERIRSVVSDLQPSKTIWILGIPHLPENRWRTDAMREINSVPQDATVYELFTFDYADTFCKLEQVYRQHEYTSHIEICPLGSKLQNVGVALFCLLREDVGLWYSTPESFNPKQYTEGAEKLWRIDFGPVESIVDGVLSCGKLQIVE
jgi:hypothetical protein